MEEISIKATDVLLKKNYIEESMYSIYQYGIQMALEIGCSFITSVIICFMWGKVMEGILFFVVFIPLRTFLGGIHLKSYWGCYVCSCLTLIIMLGLSSLEIEYPISWLILSISIVIVFLEARKESGGAEGKYFYDRVCVSIVMILMIGIVLTVLGAASKLFLLACTSVLVTGSKLLEETQAVKI